MVLSDLKASFSNNERRFNDKSTALKARSRRSDAGKSRLSPLIQAKLKDLLLTQERPSMAAIMSSLRTHCQAHNSACPSRGSVYNFCKYLSPPSYEIESLPKALRATLYNLGEDAVIPGAQLVYYAFHYGSTAALCQASALPWIDLYQASLRPAWRPRSRGLLEAVMRARGIVF